MQKDSTLVRSPSWLCLCSFSGSYYCSGGGATFVLFFSIFPPLGISPPPTTATALPNWLIARSCQQLVNWCTTASVGNVAAAVVSEWRATDVRLDQVALFALTLLCVGVHMSFVWGRGSCFSFVYAFGDLLCCRLSVTRSIALHRNGDLMVEITDGWECTALHTLLPFCEMSYGVTVNTCEYPISVRFTLQRALITAFKWAWGLEHMQTGPGSKPLTTSFLC